MFSQKEMGLLQDMKSEEEHCIEKYTKYEHNASNPKLKELMSKIAGQEREHLQTLNSIINGNVPPVPQSTTTPAPQPVAGYTKDSPEFCNDKFICSDLLSTEKHVSSLYNVSVFEFKDTSVRGNLSHIQTEEQQHGEMLYNYMEQNQMYC